MVNQPRLPLTHRAASSAPRANVDRLRAVCVNVSVSTGPSNPTVWVPGTLPTRVDATSIGASYPDDSIAVLSATAVPEGASIFAA